MQLSHRLRSEGIRRHVTLGLEVSRKISNVSMWKAKWHQLFSGQMKILSGSGNLHSRRHTQLTDL